MRVPCTARRSKSVNPKGNQYLIFAGRSNAEAEALIWPTDAKRKIIGKDPDARKD